MARADRSGCYAVPVERVLAGFEELLVADDE
jgi:hypothetical protein